MDDVASGDMVTTGEAQYLYRANPPLIWVIAAVAVTTPPILMGGAFGPNWHWALLWWVVCAGLALGVERYGLRRVILTPDLRLRVRGRKQAVEIDVDVRQLEEISLSPIARWTGGHARVRWQGGSFRLWSDVQYVSGPADQTGLRPGRWSRDGFRDLVYRLRLANPNLVVRGVRPPSWAWRRFPPS